MIVWDEAPVANKWCFETLDKSLKDIMGTTEKPCEHIFGGKVLVFGGDFRPILPIVPRETRFDIVHSTINASYIWEHGKVLTLTKNMRLVFGSNSNNAEEIDSRSKWILQVGEGKVSEPNDEFAEITIPPEFLLIDFVDPIEIIDTSTYPNLVENLTNPDFLQSRSILANTIEIVDEINDYITNLLLGYDYSFIFSILIVNNFIYYYVFLKNMLCSYKVMKYLSSDSIDRSEANDNEVFERLENS
ncbi:uncharacterized protein LOC131613469 [Vicia villosa]|uniref:uncharacterized protein LOC131613469 n=1 Tax=Vicia villosa TaxID=3911 RepID=UPI00273B717E|nr:uncharacterized protein LOC131613469 [Vicia villosa]